MRRERDDLQPGKWEPGCENPDASCDPAAGTGGSGDQVRGGMVTLRHANWGTHTQTDRQRPEHRDCRGIREEMDHGHSDGWRH